MKLWPVAPLFHSLLESENIQNIARCHFFTSVQEITCYNVLYFPRFQKWVKKKGQLVRVSFGKKLLLIQNWYFNATSENNWSYFAWCRFLSLISIQCDRSWNWRASKHLNPLTRYSVYNEECYKYWTGQTIPRQSPYERCDNGRLS